MKTIIAGSRTIDQYELVEYAISKIDWQITEVISGMASGVDKFGLRYAHENNIPSKKFPADWDRYGKSAGPKRNTQMAQYGEALIAIWDGKSKGTKNMITQAKEHGLLVVVFLEEELKKEIRDELEEARKSTEQSSEAMREDIELLKKKVESLEIEVGYLRGNRK